MSESKNTKVVAGSLDESQGSWGLQGDRRNCLRGGASGMNGPATPRDHVIAS